ncbi:MAG: hypothetical protein LC750_16730 [Actinobacteria bacterium]|nr:hypothetical protein [Actinomycetota bacterium]
MADELAGVTEQIFEPSPARIQAGPPTHYPWLFSFTGEDVLEVTSWNSAAGVRLRISGRMHASPDLVIPFSATHTPASDRSAVTSIVTLPPGELLNAIVWAESGAPQAGQTFVRVAVRRGMGAAFERLGVLIQGPVTASAARAFPGSPVQSPLEGEPYLRVISGTTPGAGGDISETVPTGARWEVISLFFVFATSAVVGDRRINVAPLSGGENYAGTSNFSTVPASTTNSFSFAQNLPSTSDPINSVYQGAMMDRFLLLAGATLRVNVSQRKAGDAFSGISYVVREWIDV